ncbi:RcnB family protein [Sphingobium subterraneum]|uniref:17 kDa surface antigen n=1 Tax=Sphingobium subterraneum TaxID=627688 RepID=A0A841J760_9SPHN|nr:RcnB family protein [Sphingobium subterraneum]MBB6124365.1 hypothetical protein [Sphingobium subterraneum]
MRRLLLSGLALGLVSGFAPAAIANDSGRTPTGMPSSTTWHQGGYGMQRGHGGVRGMPARRAFVGYVLPRVWMQRVYYIPNYSVYGLPAPTYGYGWSRYYDDAVLTDRYGRVYDSRSGIAWDRGYDGYRDDRRRGNAVAGGVIGGVVGGVIGNRIAGSGNRVVGTVLSAGAGALAGTAIANAASDRRDPPPPPGPRGPGPVPYDMSVTSDDHVTYNGGTSGRWVGTWYGDDGRVYSGEYRGRYDGTVSGEDHGKKHKKRKRHHHDEEISGGPHWSDLPPPPEPMPADGPHEGYYANGYYYPGTTVTTTVIEPNCTKTTKVTYVTETVSRPARRVVHRPSKLVRIKSAPTKLVPVK